MQQRQGGEPETVGAVIHPWDEVWELKRDGVGHYDVYIAKSANQARAQLISAAPDMARLLLALEGPDTCSHCDRRMPMRDHETDCEWLRVMRLAGVRT